MLTAAQRTFTACSLALLAIRVVWLPTTAVALSSSSSFSQGRMTNPNSAVVEALDVAIIGGGPSGLATALALMRGAPKACRNLAVFEADTFTPKGASIVVSKPGWRALRCIDKAVYRKAKRDGAPVAAFYFKDFSGQNRLPRIARFFIGSLLYPVLRLLRTGLVRANGWHAVREILRQGCLDARRDLGFDSDHDNNCAPSLIRSNMTLTDVRTANDDQESVQLTFQDGTQVRASIVLACDGTFSKVRKCLEQQQEQQSTNISNRMSPFLIDEHRTVWRGTAPHVDSHGRATFYVAAPRGSSQADSAATAATFPAGLSVPGTAVSIILPSVSGRATSSDDARARLHGALRQLGENVDPDLIHVIDDVDYMLEHKLHVRDFDAHPHLTSGHPRIALVGDAAHPLRPIGEGVALALEDAWTLGKLAQEKASTAKNEENGLLTPALLQQYVEQRESRVKAVCGAVREFAETFYNDKQGMEAIQHDEAKDGKLKTKKTVVLQAMKEFPIQLEPL